MDANDSPTTAQFPRLQLAMCDNQLAPGVLLPFATFGRNERRLYNTLTRFQNQDHGRVAGDCYELGRQLLQRGRYRAAWPALEISLSLRSRRAEPTMLDEMLASLEALLDEIVLLSGGARYLERALLVWCAVRHPMHPQVGEILNNLGYLHKQKGRLQDARDCYERALVIWKEAFGMRHAYVAAVLNNLGALARKTGNTVQARRRYRQALSISRAVNGDNHTMTESILDGLGIVCRDDDRLALCAGSRAKKYTFYP